MCMFCMDSAKLLSRADADGALLAAAKKRDADDTAVLVALEKFWAKGPAGLSSAAEKSAVVRALTRQLEEEENMFEAVERDEISLQQLTPVTMRDLQMMKQDTVRCGWARFTM